MKSKYIMILSPGYCEEETYFYQTLEEALKEAIEFKSYFNHVEIYELGDNYISDEQIKFLAEQKEIKEG